MGARVEIISNLLRTVISRPDLYRIPKIQRSFVWNWDKVKNLFESLYKGYPVGILVFWKTTEYIPSDPIIGTDKEQQKESYSKDYYYYILDGNQRLTSLILAVNNWNIKRGDWDINLQNEDSSHSDIYYDPNSDNFTFSKISKNCVSITTILKNKLFPDQSTQKEIEHCPPEIRQKIYTVADRILGHDIPIYEIEKSVKDYKELCEIFNRINFGGVKIKQLDMVLSFFASEFSDFKDRIVKISEKYDIDLRAVIRFVFHEFGIKQSQLTREGALNITKRIKEEYTDSAIDNILNWSEQAIKVGLRFLDNLGIRNSKFIPSQISLIPIWAWIYNKIQSNVEDPVSILMSNKMNILRWWIPVILRQHYTTPDRKLQIDLDTIHKHRQKNLFPADDLLKNTLKRKKAEKSLTIGEIEMLEDFSARKKVFKMIIAILLNLKGAKDFHTKEPISKLIEEDKITVHHIFSRTALAKAGVSFEEADIQHFANITLLHPQTNYKLRDLPPSEYLYSLRDSELDSHYIPLDDSLWNCHRFEDFLQERKRLIIDELRKYGILR